MAGGERDVHPAVREFAAALRELREAAGKPSVGSLAQAIGISSGNVWNAFGGHRRPSRRLTQALAQALGADPEVWGERWDAMDAAQRAARGRTWVIRRDPDGVKLCSVDGCPNRTSARWCSTHQRHYELYGDPTAGRFSPKTHPSICSVDGCDRPYYASRFCRRHYYRRRTSD